MSEDIKTLIEKLDKIARYSESPFLKESTDIKAKKRVFVNKGDEIKLKIITESIFEKLEKRFGEKALVESYENVLWKIALALNISPKRINQIIMENDALKKRIDKVIQRSKEHDIEATARKLISPKELEKIEKPSPVKYDTDIEKLRQAAEEWIEARKWNPRYDRAMLTKDIAEDNKINPIDLTRYLMNTGLWDYNPDLLR